MKKLLPLLMTIACHISSAQIITTCAGNGTAGFSGEGVLANSASLNTQYGIWKDNFGNLYIADALNNRVRKVDPAGIITTIAGTGTAGFSGDGGAPLAAELNEPISVAVDGAGNVYINDMQNNRIREIKNMGESGSIIITIAGTGAPAYSGDGGQATNAAIYSPQGIFVDAAGYVLFGDEYNHRVRKISPSGIITTVAGNGTPGYTGDGMAATASGLYNPSGVYEDAAGNVYIGDYYDSRIRKVNTAGIISTVAGIGTPGYGGDGGPATLAVIRYPKDVFMNSAGDLIFADSDNEIVRKIDHTTGVISTIAGTPGGGTYGGDGGPATDAQLWEPQGLFIDASNNIYIGDGLNNRVRLVGLPSLQVNNTGNYAQEEIAIFPNPATNELTIQSSQLISEVVITNLLGQTFCNVKTAQYGNAKIDVSNFPSGLYLVRINGSTVRKFVKQ